MIISIKKRDGRVVPFDPSKIEHAIAHCFMGSGSQKSDETAQELAALVVSQLENDENIPSVPSVEQVQDVVERVLIEKGFVRSAKAYILYRAERSRVREMNTRLMKVFEDIASKDAVDSDIKRENANINGDTAMGSMLKFGSEGAKQFYEMYVLDPRFSAAHHDGDIHIHDLDFYTLTTTCCQIDLLDLFHGGFSTGHGFLREPNDIQSYVRQQHNIRIGERTAEAIKCSIGAAVSDLEEEPEDFVVTGPNMLTALPQTVSLSYSEIAYALEKSLTKIDAALMKVLESMPPELYADIVKNGIYLAGGGALIKGLDRRLGEKTGIPFHVAEDPLRAIARGTGIALKNINRFSFLMK